MLFSLLAVALCGVAAWLSVRWYGARVDGLGRLKPFPWLSVGLAATLGLGAAVPAVRHERLERRLSHVASKLADRKVSVRCQDAGGAFFDAGAELGYVKFRPDGSPTAEALVKRTQCGDLASYLASDKTAPTRAHVVAVHLLTHEAMHLRGETAEAVAECEAMQRDARTARLLGASPDAAAALAREYWRAVYPRMPPAYTTPHCRAGGDLDEGLADAPWLP